MGTTLIEIVIIVNLIFLFLYFVIPRKKRKSFPGTIKDTAGYLQTLKNSDLPDPYLIISAPDKEDYIQFTYKSKGFDMEYQMTTDHQGDKEGTLKKLANNSGLKVEETKSEDGTSTFLHLFIEGEPEDASEIVTGLLRDVFNATDDSKIEFEINT